MHYYCIILAMSVLILLILINRTELFTVETGELMYDPIDVSETYTWPCTDCIKDIYLKPKFKYNLSDNRCLNNMSQDYSTLVSELTDVSNYSKMPTTNFNSCDSRYNTMYGSVSARYLFLTNTIAFTISSISIKSKGSEISYSVIVTYTPEGSYLEPSILQGAVWPNSKNMQIDFGSNIDMDTIVITHNTQTAANSFVNTTLNLCNDTGSIDFAPVVFRILITKTDLVKTIYTQNTGKILYPNTNMLIRKSFTWPCTTCLTYTGKLYRGSNYYAADGRCFKAKEYIPSSYLTNAISNFMSKSTMDTYFATCMTTRDTRSYDPIYSWDSNKISGMFNISSAVLTVNSDVTVWNDVLSSTTIKTRDTIYKARLEEEIRNGIAYKYVRTQRMVYGYIEVISSIFTAKNTVFIVFRQNTGDYTPNMGNILMSNSDNSISVIHGSDGKMVVTVPFSSVTTADYSPTDLTTRVWGFRFSSNNITILTPLLVQMGLVMHFLVILDY